MESKATYTNKANEETMDFVVVLNKMLDTYTVKNKAYDGAFAKRFAKRGLAYAVDKISEKCDRVVALESNPDIDNFGESIEDTLLDMANYCAMTLVELNKRRKQD